MNRKYVNHILVDYDSHSSTTWVYDCHMSRVKVDGVFHNSQGATFKNIAAKSYNFQKEKKSF